MTGRAYKLAMDCRIGNKGIIGVRILASEGLNFVMGDAIEAQKLSSIKQKNLHFISSQIGKTDHPESSEEARLEISTQFLRLKENILNKH